MKRLFTLSLCAILLQSACRPAQPEPIGSTWRPAPESSFVLRSGDRGVDERLVRCWPVDTEFGCLDVRQVGRIRITQTYALSDLRAGLRRGLGYSCDIFYDEDGRWSLIQEYLRGNGTPLSRRVRPGDPARQPWPKAFADGFTRESSVPLGRRWFDCRMIASTIERGSMDALATELVERGTLFGN